MSWRSCDNHVTPAVCTCALHFIVFAGIGRGGGGWGGGWGDRHWGKEAHQLHSRSQHELHQLHHWLRNHRYIQSYTYSLQWLAKSEKHESIAPIIMPRYTLRPSSVWFSHWYGSPHPGGYHHRLHCHPAHQRCLSGQQVLLPGDGDSCLWSPRVLVPHLCTVLVPLFWWVTVSFKHPHAAVVLVLCTGPRASETLESCSYKTL